MIVFSVVGMIWIVITLLFVWMVVHYGISQGKERDVAKEFEAKETDRQKRDLGQPGSKAS